MRHGIGSYTSMGFGSITVPGYKKQLD